MMKDEFYGVSSYPNNLTNSSECPLLRKNEYQGNIYGDWSGNIAGSVFPNAVGFPDNSLGYREKGYLKFLSNVLRTCYNNSNFEKSGKFVSESQKTSFPSDDQNNEREYYMSFVGIIKCQDGLVAFGDSKSTSNRNDPFGGIRKDPNKDRVQKVFSNDDFLLCTFGVNTITNMGKTIYIEDWIRQNIKICKTPIEFSNKFSSYIRDNSDAEAEGDLCYQFFFSGFDEKKRAYFQEATITRKNLTMNFLDYGFDVLRNTIQEYTPWLDHRIWSISTSEKTVQNISKIIEEELSRKIEELDKICSYNPVGGPIQIRTLYNPK